MAEIPSANFEEGGVVAGLVDPWLDSKTNCDYQLSFDDDFSPEALAVKSAFVKMPDSNEYLSTLEAKLKQIKGGPKGSGGGRQSKENSKNAKTMIEDLMAVKEGHMSRLMSSETAPETGDAAGGSFESNYGTSLDQPIQMGAFDFLRSRIRPETQALTAEELFALIGSDFLNSSASAATATASTTADAAPSSGAETDSHVCNE